MKHWRDITLVALAIMQLTTLAIIGYAYYAARSVAKTVRETFAATAPPHRPPVLHPALSRDEAARVIAGSREFVAEKPADWLPIPTLAGMSGDLFEQVAAVLTSSGLATGDLSSGLTLTDAAKQLPEIRPQQLTSDIEGWQVHVISRELDHVTGIAQTENADVAEVEFVWKHSWTRFGQLLRGQMWDEARNQRWISRATLRRFDDGWRVMNVDGLEGTTANLMKP